MITYSSVIKDLLATFFQDQIWSSLDRLKITLYPSYPLQDDMNNEEDWIKEHFSIFSFTSFNFYYSVWNSMSMSISYCYKCSKWSLSFFAFIFTIIQEQLIFIKPKRWTFSFTTNNLFAKLLKEHLYSFWHLDCILLIIKSNQSFYGSQSNIFGNSKCKIAYNSIFEELWISE